jgi:carotenoid cleavage dioxygenase-like enzyme
MGSHARVCRRCEVHQRQRNARRERGRVSNTHIVAHAGRLFALSETSLPVEVTRELATVGCFDFDGRLTTGMTAHPKVCPRTGELHFFAYNWQGTKPWLTYYRADAQGRLVQTEVIEVPGLTLMHDFAITERHVIFMDLPIVFDAQLAKSGFPFRWSDDYGARLGVMPRGGTTADVRWFEIAPCWVAHTFNAYEEETGGIVMDVVRSEQIFRVNEPLSPPLLHQWKIDFKSGRVVEQPRDDRAIEFPRFDDRRMGGTYRHGYALYSEHGADISAATAVIKYDLRSGASIVHDFGAGRFPSEPVFVPASATADEDEGWLMMYVYDSARDTSDLVILNAADVAGKPVATVALPQRVPVGLHGNWIDDR